MTLSARKHQNFMKLLHGPKNNTLPLADTKPDFNIIFRHNLPISKHQLHTGNTHLYRNHLAKATWIDNISRYCEQDTL